MHHMRPPRLFKNQVVNCTKTVQIASTLKRNASAKLGLTAFIFKVKSNTPCTVCLAGKVQLSSLFSWFDLNRMLLLAIVGVLEVAFATYKSETKDVLVFAIKQRNLEVIHQRLMVVSDQMSAEYGRFWTQADMKELILDKLASTTVKKYFQRNGVKIVHESLDEVYLAALATTAVWESLLKTKFYEYNHDSNYMQPTSFNNFTLDKNISSYVSAVFRVYRDQHHNSKNGETLLQQVPISPIKSSGLNIIISQWRDHECATQFKDKSKPR